ncbi:MAG: 2-amino-4-hydroxy-6-hydroxymethyldihydropteridine diphosphokinase [Prevotellaceae bacterium]|nr:2-amino-4-hydroxy-6-hydroxymethyldihydropteridine diphosphokinase [Prevotellaceae bacterium]
MVKVIMALGSNNNQQANIEKAKEELYSLFGTDIVFTKSVWTQPIGIESEKFLNCLAFINTGYSLEQTTDMTKRIETICGNSKEKRKANIVNMDIDILKYNNIVLHEKDWNRKYIKELMDSEKDK